MKSDNRSFAKKFKEVEKVLMVFMIPVYLCLSYLLEYFIYRAQFKDSSPLDKLSKNITKLGASFSAFLPAISHYYIMILVLMNLVNN